MPRKLVISIAIAILLLAVWQIFKRLPGTKITVKGGAVSIEPTIDMKWYVMDSVQSKATAYGINPNHYSLAGFQDSTTTTKPFQPSWKITETTTDGQFEITFSNNNVVNFASEGGWFGSVANDNSRQYCGSDNSCRNPPSVTGISITYVQDRQHPPIIVEAHACPPPNNCDVSIKQN